jgi:hypothetical protein
VPRRPLPDPKTFDISVPCPGCAYPIQPAEILRTDGENAGCPKCDLIFDYDRNRKPSPSTP